MIWSLLKALIFIAAVALLTYGTTWLAGADGELRIAFLGYEANLGPLTAAIAILVFAALLWLLFKLVGLLVATIRFLNGDETALSRYFDRNRERRGYRALGDAMMALASGEGREALSNARRADRYLDRPDLTGLLIAQAAEAVGDTRTAEDQYKRLVSDERTRFVGIRGVMKQRLAEGDTDTAMRLAEKAFALRPRNTDVADTLLRLQTGEGDWGSARETLKAKLKHGSLPRDVYRRRDAILALADAGDVRDPDAGPEAREAAIEANRLSPDLVPAAVAAARAYIAQGKPKYAARVLRACWDAGPHPDLAAAFAEIAPDETPQERIKRFEVLTKQKPDHPESRMLLAELNIAAEDFPAARRALGDLAETNPTVRSLMLMAAIEQGEGADESVVRAYLARAVGAPRGPQWVCSVSGAVYSEWRPVCEVSGAFDSLVWTEPPAPAVEAPATMLPLIVGAPAALSSPEAEEAHAVVAEALPPETSEPAGPAGGEPIVVDTPPAAADEPRIGAPPPIEPANPAPGAAVDAPRPPGRP